MVSNASRPLSSLSLTVFRTRPNLPMSGTRLSEWRRTMFVKKYSPLPCQGEGGGGGLGGNVVCVEGGTEGALHVRFLSGIRTLGRCGRCWRRWASSLDTITDIRKDSDYKPVWVCDQETYGSCPDSNSSCSKMRGSRVIRNRKRNKDTNSPIE